MKIKLRFGPRSSHLTGDPDSIGRLLQAAATGARYLGREWPNGDPLRAQWDEFENDLKSLQYKLGDDLLQYQQGRGM